MMVLIIVQMFFVSLMKMWEHLLMMMGGKELVEWRISYV